MNKPYKKEFLLPDGSEITSLVMDEYEFVQLCDKLKGILEDYEIDFLKMSQIIPLIIKNPSTEFVFGKYDVQTDKICVVVRGKFSNNVAMN